MRKRRYEILLPLKYNDGRPVGGELLEQTRDLLVQRFKGLTFWPQSLRGVWIHQGVRYVDELALVVVDVADTRSSREFFRRLKVTLLERFEQLEIYIVSFPVEIL